MRHTTTTYHFSCITITVSYLNLQSVFLSIDHPTSLNHGRLDFFLDTRFNYSTRTNRVFSFITTFHHARHRLEGPCPSLCLCYRSRQRTHDILDDLPKTTSWYVPDKPWTQIEWALTLETAESANLAPWFGPHLQRNVYLSLLHLEDGTEKGPKVPESVLRAALLRRAVEDIRRLIQIKSAKQACGSLLARGSVGDDLWQRFQRAEKEMEEELRDVVTEVCPLASSGACAVI